MEVVIVRDEVDGEATIGRVFIDGLFFSYSLEDPVRKKKIAKITAINAGRYRLLMYNSPKHGRVPRIFREVGLNIVEPENFSFVEIHPGNTPKDTEGCVLLGLERSKDGHRISRSRDACRAFTDQVEAVIKKGGSVYLTLINPPNVFTYDA